MNTSICHYKLGLYSQTPSNKSANSSQMQHYGMHSNQHTNSYNQIPVCQFYTRAINTPKDQIKIQPQFSPFSQYSMPRKDSTKNIQQYVRKDSIRCCSNDFSEDGGLKENIMDISDDLRQQPQRVVSRFYQTEKMILKEENKNNKNQALFETSSTMKQISCNSLKRKHSFYPTSKSKNKNLSRQESTRDRKSIFMEKVIDGDCFDIIKPLGKGKYGKVFLVRDKTNGFILALKAIEKKKIIEANLLEQFIRQIKIQSYLDHPGIIKLYGLFCDSQNIYLLLELGSDGQLYDKISDSQLLSEESAAYIARQLLESVDYMHREKILHRDIKPENIVVILGNLKICDFGWAVYNNSEMRSTFCGTPMYFSPQLLSKQEYDEKVDLWAVGVLTYELVVGKSPFNLKEPKDLGRIVTQEVQFPKLRTLSYEFKRFISRVLEKDPQKRPNSKELLNQKFIRKYRSIQICEQLCGMEGKTGILSRCNSKEKKRRTSQDRSVGKDRSVSQHKRDHRDR